MRKNSTADLHRRRKGCGVFWEKKAMACLDEGGGLWYSNGEKSITDKRSAQFRVLNKL